MHDTTAKAEHPGHLNKFRGRLKEFILKQVRLLFHESEVFVGTYADNEIAARKWAVGKNIYVLRIKTERYKTRHKFKLVKHIVIYVHRNSITDWLGYRPMPDHFRLFRKEGNNADKILKVFGE